jgi:hypothetical protein
LGPVSSPPIEVGSSVVRRAGVREKLGGRDDADTE